MSMNAEVDESLPLDDVQDGALTIIEWIIADQIRNAEWAVELRLDHRNKVRDDLIAAQSELDEAEKYLRELHEGMDINRDRIMDVVEETRKRLPLA